MNYKFKEFFKGKKLFSHFFVSFLVIFFWLAMVKDWYYYNHRFFEIYGINLLPLTFGTIGLFFIYLVYAFVLSGLKESNPIKQFIIFIAIAWVILIAAETIGYYLFDIHNLKTANYPGLPICNCIHAPAWMKLGYFLIGPIYIFICHLLKLETNKPRQLSKKLDFC